MGVGLAMERVSAQPPLINIVNKLSNLLKYLNYSPHETHLTDSDQQQYKPDGDSLVQDRSTNFEYITVQIPDFGVPLFGR